MRKILAASLAAVLAIQAAALTPTTTPTTKPTVISSSTDGVEYGSPADLPSIKPIHLPLLNMALGNPPEQLVFHRPVYSAEATDKVKQLKNGFHFLVRKETNVQFQFYAKGTNSDVVGFDVAHGLVVRIGLLWKVMSDGKANDLQHQLANIAAKNPLLNFQIIRSLDQSQSGMLVVQIDPQEFTVAATEPTPEIAGAIRTGKLLVGMTEEQANAAEWKLYKQVVDSTADSKIVTWSKVIYKDESVSAEQQFVAPDVNRVEQRMVRAQIQNGTVEEITNY